MKNLLIPKTDKSPEVSLKPDGTLELVGIALMQDAASFFKPIMEWIEPYSQELAEDTILEIKLKYFNGSVEKCLFELLEKIVSLYDQGNFIDINCYFHKVNEINLDRFMQWAMWLNYPLNFFEIDHF